MMRPVATCAGSTGGEQSSRDGPTRQPMQSESGTAPPLKGRGTGVGAKMLAYFHKHKEKLKVEFDEYRNTYKSFGEMVLGTTAMLAVWSETYASPTMIGGFKCLRQIRRQSRKKCLYILTWTWTIKMVFFPGYLIGIADAANAGLFCQDFSRYDFQ